MGSEQARLLQRQQRLQARTAQQRAALLEQAAAVDAWVGAGQTWLQPLSRLGRLARRHPWLSALGVGGLLLGRPRRTLRGLRWAWMVYLSAQQLGLLARRRQG